MQLDPSYMGLVSQALEHANKGIQRVGLAVLEEISQDSALKTQLLPSRLQVLTQRLDDQQSGCDKRACESEVPGLLPLRKENDPPSESEPGLQGSKDGRLRDQKTGSTLNTKALKEELRTESHERNVCELRFPTRFSSLTPPQQTGAKVALMQLTPDLRQAVLDEWAARCRNTQVRNPAGYLFGIIQKAMHGHFTAWAAKSDSHELMPSEPTPRQVKKAKRDPTVAQTYLAELKGRFQLR
jgi:hypothetical protein